jgi:DNA polymerase (family 10)
MKSTPPATALADDLREIGLRLSLSGNARYAARAYEEAARTVEATPLAQIKRLARRGELESLRGVGKSIARELTALLYDRNQSRLEKLRNEDAEEAAAMGERVERADVKGLIHCHTTYSDGKDSVLAMAKAAEAKGFQYITITDHSPSAFYAHGVTLDRLAKQWEEIDAAQEQVGIRILRGVESDILKDGELDYPPAILDRLDVIIASIHSRYKQDEDAMTARIVRALRQPWFKIWGHPLGRLIGSRPPVPVRMDEVFAAAVESRVAFEVNGDPARLDLPPEWIQVARTHHIPFVVSSDAHSTRSIGYTDLAVAVARKGGLRTDEVLNTLPVDEFLERVRPLRHDVRALRGAGEGARA